MFSNVLVYCIMWAILHITAGQYDTQIGPDDIHKFQKVVLIGMTTGLVASMIFHCVVKEGANGSANGSVKHSNTNVRTIQQVYKWIS